MKHKYPKVIYGDYEEGDEFYCYATPHGQCENVKYTRSDLITKWHKYPEEKPKDNTEVLVCLKDHSMLVDWYYGEDRENKWNQCVYGDYIVAWMELPELPKFYKET